MKLKKKSFSSLSGLPSRNKDNWIVIDQKALSRKHSRCRSNAMYISMHTHAYCLYMILIVFSLSCLFTICTRTLNCMFTLCIYLPTHDLLLPRRNGSPHFCAIPFRKQLLTQRFSLRAKPIASAFPGLFPGDV